MAQRPVVGVTGYSTDRELGRQLGYGPRELAIYAEPYFAAVAAQGMIPVPVTPYAPIADQLELFDAVLLTGGADIDPSRYGQRPHQWTMDTCPGRDELELEVLAGAAGLGLPALGVCRGLQLMNISRGGTLHQHLPDLDGAGVHSTEWATGERRASQRWVETRHDVTVLDPALARYAGPALAANSYHHQGIAEVGDGLRVAACASDGLIESLIAVDQPWLGVQWHPELHTREEKAGSAPFRWLADRVAASRLSVAGGPRAGRVAAAR